MKHEVFKKKATAFQNILQVQSLSCWRGDRLLFQNLGFQIAPGQLLGLEGHNGVGKSSLLAIIAGLLTPSTGKVIYKGLPLALDNVLWLGPRAAFYPHLSLKDNLMFWAMMNTFTKECVLEALDVFKLSNYSYQPLSSLSRGQTQRAHLCRLRLSRAPIWLLDEPLAGLDAQGQTILHQEIRQFVEKGGLVIMAPHLPDWCSQSLNVEHFKPGIEQGQTV